MRFLSDRYRRPVLEYIYIPITLECNRNCKGCVSCSPLAGKETRITMVQYTKTLERLIEIAGTETIQKIDISGGEPLIHPDVLEFLKVTKNIFNNSIIEIRTNGILLPAFIEENYKLLQELNIQIGYSEYPGIDLEGISYLCRKYNLNRNPRWGGSEFKFIKMGVCERANYLDMNEEWDKCCDKNSCNNIRIIGDRAYFTGCTAPVYVDVLDKYFGTSFEKLLKKGDRIDLFDKNTTLDDLLNFHQPIMFCAHCRRRTNTFFDNTKLSGKSKDEWLVIEGGDEAKNTDHNRSVLKL